MSVFSLLVIVHALAATVWTGHLVLDLGELPRELRAQSAAQIRAFEEVFEPTGAHGPRHPGAHRAVDGLDLHTGLPGTVQPGQPDRDAGGGEAPASGRRLRVVNAPAQAVAVRLKASARAAADGASPPLAAEGRLAQMPCLNSVILPLPLTLQ